MTAKRNIRRRRNHPRRRNHRQGKRSSSRKLGEGDHFSNKDAMTVIHMDSSDQNNSTTAATSLPSHYFDISASAPYSTRETILLTEAIVVTVLVLLCCFVCQCASRKRRGGGGEGTMAGQDAFSSSLRRGRAEDGANTSTTAAASALDAFQADPPPPSTNTLIQRTIQTLTSLPESITSIILYPFHLIDEGVHSWSTTNADIIFLRSVMERLEEERISQLEDVEERGERLKLAFSKGCVVWEIADGHFIPPPTIDDGIDPCLLKEQRMVLEKIVERGGDETQQQQVDELDEEEQEKLDDIDCGGDGNDDDDAATATNTADEVHTAANAVTINSEEEGDDKKEEVKVEKEEEEVRGGGNSNNDEERNEQRHQSSPLIPNEKEDFIGEEPPQLFSDSTSARTLFSANGTVQSSTSFFGVLPLSLQTRSSSPSEAGGVITATEANVTSTPPAFLYLPHRGNRANTNETNISTTLPSLALSSSLSHQYRLTSQSSESIASNSSLENKKYDNEEELKSIPNNCAVCLSEYVTGDTIVTSCNPRCPHAFHQECIVEWLVKMQVGTPCPCCRRTFVELSPSRPEPSAAAAVSTTSPEEEQRRREELRRTIELGFRRGRAFDFSVISLR